MSIQAPSPKTSPPVVAAGLPPSSGTACNIRVKTEIAVPWKCEPLWDGKVWCKLCTCLSSANHADQ
eukprot:79620-Amphidinium_carterae.3